MEFQFCGFIQFQFGDNRIQKYLFSRRDTITAITGKDCHWSDTILVSGFPIVIQLYLWKYLLRNKLFVNRPVATRICLNGSNTAVEPRLSILCIASFSAMKSNYTHQHRLVYKFYASIRDDSNPGSSKIKIPKAPITFHSDSNKIFNRSYHSFLTNYINLLSRSHVISYTFAG